MLWTFLGFSWYNCVGNIGITRCTSLFSLLVLIAFGLSNADLTKTQKICWCQIDIFLSPYCSWKRASGLPRSTLLDNIRFDNYSWRCQFLWVECPFCQSTNGVRSLNETQSSELSQWPHSYFIDHQTPDSRSIVMLLPPILLRHYVFDLLVHLYMRVCLHACVLRWRHFLTGLPSTSSSLYTGSLSDCGNTGQPKVVRMKCIKYTGTLHSAVEHVCMFLSQLSQAHTKPRYRYCWTGS